MKNILVPVAASVQIESTLQYAIDFAKHFKAKVYVLGDYNVVSRAGSIININDILERETKTHIIEIVSKVNTKDIEIATITAKGNLVDVIEDIVKELKIDLVILESNSTMKSNVFLDNVSGSIIKRTEIPSLIVPCEYTFSKPSSALLAFKSGILKRKKVLKPIKELRDAFDLNIRLLMVKTPKHKAEDLIINPKLQALGEITTTENATTFQGVLEHFHKNEPDLLCVFRRKRGFFKKLWEKNTISKEEFHCKIPVLILVGKL